MIICTHCRTEVPTSARRCPNCLENPYDGFGVWNTIITIAIIGGLGYFLFG